MSKKGGKEPREFFEQTAQKPGMHEKTGFLHLARNLEVKKWTLAGVASDNFCQTATTPLAMTILQQR